MIGHACEVETSQCMYLCPWVVHENLQPGQLHTESMYFRKVLSDGAGAWNWKKWTPLKTVHWEMQDGPAGRSGKK